VGCFPLKRNQNRNHFIQRLTALWALNEAGLGGLMHALRIPFTGVFIGGTAVILISLIAYFSRPDFRTILKSMLIVLIIKAVASPHSPINAYFAVIFQGLVGFLLFMLIKNLKVAAFLLAILALLEGAVQKILVLTLIYGQSLWQATDVFFDFILKKFGVQESSFSLSELIIGLYFAIHLIGGIIVGWLSIKFFNLMEHLPQRLNQLPELNWQPRAQKNKKSKSKYKKFLKLALLVLFVFASLTFFSSDDGLIQGLIVFFRVFALVLLWYLFLGPFLLKRLHQFLSKKSQRYSQEVESIHDLMPALKVIVFTLWNESAKFNFFKRWRYFLSNLILMSLFLEADQIKKMNPFSIENS